MESVYTVGQVNKYIKNMFNQDFALNRISIKGEISNCKYHSTGHIYFNLKDETGVINAVMFSSSAKSLNFRLENGNKVIATGAVTVYERDGKYQLYANRIIKEGTGDLFLKYTELKNTLEQMGMFDSIYKKPIPQYALKIGVVTAATGAAIKDICNISFDRNPHAQLFLYSALVQGEGAKESIVKGIQYLDKMNLDVIIIGRGGGSIEDLWAFNEECVAKAIFNCNTPIISGVGHETDFTIADFVADFRAPTPSGAAQTAVFDYVAFCFKLDNIKSHINKEMMRVLNLKKSRCNILKQTVLKYRPQLQLLNKKQQVVDIRYRMDNIIRNRLIINKQKLALISQRLNARSPLERIGKGYAYITNDTNKPIYSIKSVNIEDIINIRIKDGTIKTRIIDKN